MFEIDFIEWIIERRHLKDFTIKRRLFVLEWDNNFYFDFLPIYSSTLFITTYLELTIQNVSQLFGTNPLEFAKAITAQTYIQQIPLYNVASALAINF